VNAAASATSRPALTATLQTPSGAGQLGASAWRSQEPGEPVSPSRPGGGLTHHRDGTLDMLGREKRMAASENVSTPPAITTSARPVWICCTPLQMAWLADMHACVTVWPVTEFGRPEPSATSRAMLLVRISCETVPHRR